MLQPEHETTPVLPVYEDGLGHEHENVADIAHIGLEQEFARIVAALA